MILITGGAGYIGSHTVLLLLQKGYEVTIFDNLETSSKSTIEKLENLSGKKINFIQGDLREPKDLEKISRDYYECVIHFAAYKNVVDSIQDPHKYYKNNVIGTYNLLNAMSISKTQNIVFSSSCSVYGNPTKLPVDENTPFSPISPYARTKTCVEYLLDDSKNINFNSVRLRYFNAAGAHHSGEIGEDPKFLMNLIPRIFGVVAGKYELKVFGNQFPTKDGYQVRDYIHVEDLADAHLKAVEFISKNNGSYSFNIGTGKGTSVKELIDEVEIVTGKKVDYTIAPVNPGEAIEIFADPSKAMSDLGWKARYDYHDIIRDAYRWYKNCDFIS